MIAGIGVDILHVARIGKVHRRHGQRFEERLLHPREKPGFARARNKADFLAKAFAVKEAFAKALGTGFHGLAHHEVGAVRGTLGEPVLVFSARLARDLKKRKVRRSLVSLSDEGGLVCAVVVLER